MKTRIFDILLALIVILIIAAPIAEVIYIRKYNYGTVIIDKCEYIRTWNGHAWTVTHKGDCTNVIHLKNK